MKTELETYSDQLWAIYPRLKPSANEKFWNKYERAIEASQNNAQQKVVSSKTTIGTKGKIKIPDIIAAYYQLSTRELELYKKENRSGRKLFSIIVKSLYFSFFATGFGHVLLGLGDDYYIGITLTIWAIWSLVWWLFDAESQGFVKKLNFELLPEVFRFYDGTVVSYENIVDVGVSRKRLRVTASYPNPFGNRRKNYDLPLYNKELTAYGRKEIDEIKRFFKLVIKRNLLKNYTSSH